MSPYRSLLGGALLALTAAAVAEVELSTSVVKLMGGATPAAEAREAGAQRVLPGDELLYRIDFVNAADAPVAAESLVITNPLPPEIAYVPGSAGGPRVEVLVSQDAGDTWVTEADAPPEAITHLRWVYRDEVAPGGEGTVSFRARLR